MNFVKTLFSKILEVFRKEHHLYDMTPEKLKSATSEEVLGWFPNEEVIKNTSPNLHKIYTNFVQSSSLVGELEALDQGLILLGLIAVEGEPYEDLVSFTERQDRFKVTQQVVWVMNIYCNKRFALK